MSNGKSRFFQMSIETNMLLLSQFENLAFFGQGGKGTNYLGLDRQEGRRMVLKKTRHHCLVKKVRIYPSSRSVLVYQK